MLVTALPRTAIEAKYLWGRGFEAMFPEGSTGASMPFKVNDSIVRQVYKGGPHGTYDEDAVGRAVRAGNFAEFDPRNLIATQYLVTREGVRYYMGDEYRQTGRTFADQSLETNRYPIVYILGDGRQAILTGHHRAIAALLKGEMLRAIRVESPEYAQAHHAVAVPRRASALRRRAVSTHGQGGGPGDQAGWDGGAPGRGVRDGRAGAGGVGHPVLCTAARGLRTSVAVVEHEWDGIYEQGVFSSPLHKAGLGYVIQPAEVDDPGSHVWVLLSGTRMTEVARGYADSPEQARVDAQAAAARGGKTGVRKQAIDDDYANETLWQDHFGPSHDLNRRRQANTLQMLAEQVCGDYGLDVGQVVVEKAAPGVSRSDCFGGIATITLGTDMMDKWTLLHEMAHVYYQSAGADEIALYHDQHFDKIFTEFLKRYGGVDVVFGQTPPKTAKTAAMAGPVYRGIVVKVTPEIVRMVEAEQWSQAKDAVWQIVNRKGASHSWEGQGVDSTLGVYWTHKEDVARHFTANPKWPEGGLPVVLEAHYDDAAAPGNPVGRSDNDYYVKGGEHEQTLSPGTPIEIDSVTIGFPVMKSYSPDARDPDWKVTYLVGRTWMKFSGTKIRTEAAYGTDYIARGLKFGIDKRWLADKFEHGTVTAQDILNALGHPGIWWGILGKDFDIEDIEDYAYVEESNSVKGWNDYFAENPDDPNWIGGEVAVMLIAKRPSRNGRPWDPEVDNEAEAGGLMGNSYLHAGESIDLVEIRYDAGWGWKTLPARGLRATAAGDGPWRPTTGMFGPGMRTLDPRIFNTDTEQMLPVARSDMWNALDHYWRPMFGEWTQWARLYLAGSGASYWWDSDSDMDLMVGVDLDRLRAARPANLDVADADIIAHLNKTLMDLRPAMAEMIFEPGAKPCDVTYFVNPGSYDVLAIHPYAAYSLDDNRWVVHPPVLPADWGPDSIPEETWRRCDQVAREAASVLSMPEPDRTAAGVVLFDWIHEGRRAAYSANGGGWLDPGNVIYQFLGLHPDHLLRRLYLCKHPEAATASDSVEKTAAESPPAAQQDVRLVLIHKEDPQAAHAALLEHVDTIGGEHDIQTEGAIYPKERRTVGEWDKGLMHAITKDHGFSLHDHVGDAPHSGYMISVDKSTEQTVPLNEIRPEAVADYMSVHQQELKDPSNYLGGWVYKGNVYLDISRHMDDQKQAMAVAKANKQLGIYDLGSGQTILT